MEAVPGKALSMSIILFEATAQNRAERSFLREQALPGLGVNGDHVRIANGGYEPCEVAAIMWSPRLDGTDRARVARAIRNVHGRNLLIFETPLFRSLPEWWLYYRVGFDHVHRGGRFAASDASDDRPRRLGLRLSPWRVSSEPVIIAGQLPGDYSLDGVDAQEWVLDVVHYLERTCERRIILRPHPLDQQTDWRRLISALPVEISHETLEADLTRAGLWISFTSGSAVDAVMAGVPNICLHQGNFAWEVSAHSLADLDRPWTGERTSWLAGLASTQWSWREIRDGSCWQALSKRVESAR